MFVSFCGWRAHAKPFLTRQKLVLNMTHCGVRMLPWTRALWGRKMERWKVGEDTNRSYRFGCYRVHGESETKA